MRKYTRAYAHALALVVKSTRGTAIMSKLAAYRVCSTPLGISEVVSLLKNPPEDGVSNLPPAKPKAGEIYIYSSKNDTEQGTL